MNRNNLDLKNSNRVVKLFSNLVIDLSFQKGNLKSSSYLKITNSDGKTWILLEKHIKTAMNLYQPSSIKGKLLKEFLPVINSIPMVGKIFKKIMRITLGFYNPSPELINRIQEVFGKIISNREMKLSYFLGTPSIHQKITIQVSSASDILGYCKITDSQEIIDIFKHEEEVLTKFGKSRIMNIPRCLYCGPLSHSSKQENINCNKKDNIYKEDIYIFIQSTIKTNKSKVIHNIELAHYEFLKELADKTRVNVEYQDTDYFKMIEGLKDNLYYVNEFEMEEMRGAGNCPTNIQQKIKLAIEKVEIELHKCGQSFSGYHSDFTPWNMFFENDTLFVFDFEYAKMTYPPMMDIFHFFTQCCIFEKNMSGEEIYRSYLSTFTETTWQKFCDYDVSISYIYYLLDIIGLYLSRDKGDFNRDVRKNLGICISILCKLLE